MSARSVRIASGYVELGMRTGKLQQQLGQIQSRLNKFANRLAKIGKLAFGGGLAIGGLLAPLVRDAANLEVTMTRLDRVFGASAQSAKDWVNAFASDNGLSISEVASQLTTFAALLKGLEFPDAEVESLSRRLVVLASNFAAANGVPMTEALNRFISAMSGSSEVLDQWGFNLKAAALDQEFLRMGLDVTTASATENQKALARLSVISNTLSRQGGMNALADSSGLVATQFARLRDAFKNFREAAGESLQAPVGILLKLFTELVKGVTNFVKSNKQLIKWAGTLAVSLVTLGSVLFTVRAGLIGLKWALKFIAKSKFVTAIKLIAKGFGLILTPATALIAIFGAILMIWREFSSNGKRAFDELGVSIAEFSKIWERTAKAFGTAFEAGDMKLAFEIALVGLRQVFSEFVGWIWDTWQKLVYDMAGLVPGTGWLLGLDFEKEMESLNELAAARRESNRLELLILQKRADALLKEKQTRQAINGDLSTAGKQTQMVETIRQASGPGTFSGFIANRLGFRGTQENREKTWKTEQTPAERKAQAEAIQKAIDNGQFKKTADDIKSEVSSINRFWSNAAVV